MLLWYFHCPSHPNHYGMPCQTTPTYKPHYPRVPGQNAFPSLIESLTDKSTNAYNIENNNNDRPAMIIRITMLTAFLDKTSSLCTHTDIVYDDDEATNYEYADYDDEYGASYDYAYSDPFDMNNPLVRLQFKQCLQIVAHTSIHSASHTASHTASLVTTKTPKKTHDDETHSRRSNTIHV